MMTMSRVPALVVASALLVACTQVPSTRDGSGADARPCRGPQELAVRAPGCGAEAPGATCGEQLAADALACSCSGLATFLRSENPLVPFSVLGPCEGDRMCMGLTEQTCQETSACKVVRGISPERYCAGDRAYTFLGCRAQGCGQGFSLGVEPGSSRTLLFETTCVPLGWSTRHWDGCSPSIDGGASAR